jgi:PTS system fructose-specific IIA component
MQFTEVLNPKTILTHLNVNNKAEALDVMADRFVEAGVINDKDQYIKDVYIREEFGETGIGNYIAIPHGKSVAAVQPSVAIAVLDHEIEWESLDDTGAKIIILFAVGADNEAAQDHLKLLAMFSKRLGDDAVINSLLKADTVEDVMSAFTGEESVSEESAEEADLDLDEISIL